MRTSLAQSSRGCLRKGLRPLRAALDQSAPIYTKFSQPVYSLATNGAGLNRDSINLVTYASPIAIKPDRCYAIGLYLGTVSHENMKAHRRGVLQVLRPQHARLFPLLGKTSARDVDKIAAAKEQGFAIAERYGVQTLGDVACVMELAVFSDFIPCGDHDVVLCRVSRFENLINDPEDVLYTSNLRAAGYL